MADRLYLNNGWLFTENFSDDLLLKEVNEGLKPVEIPHTVKETPFNYFDESIYQMVSGYKKVIKVPHEWEGLSVKLTFDGVAHLCEVYINGEKRAEHACGYTAFSVDISDDIVPGEELTIVVKVDSRENINQPPFGYVVDYMTYGGIYRDVYVEVSKKTHISDVFYYSEIKSDSVCLKGSVEVKNPGGKTLFVKTLVEGTSKEEKVNLASFDECAHVNISSDVTGVKLWSVEEPVLYTVRTELLDEAGNLIDYKENAIGFRKSEFRVDGFYLNDKKVKIRGLNRHQSYPYVGYAMPESMQRLDARILKKELGLNAVRTSHYPQSHDFIDECDRLGLLVFMEIPGWQHIGDEAWKNQAVINVRDMVKEYRNHPSIILWGVRINESQDDDEFYIRTNAEAHKYDPSRPTGGVRALKKSNLFEDVYTYNDFVHNGKNQGCDKKEKVTSDKSKPYLISEYNGHMFPTKSYDCEEHRREHAIRHANVINAVAGEEDIAGSFGWCMFDYNTHKDFGSGDRICYHGVMDMFRNEKMASLIYSCESDETDVLEISSSMDIGEHPECNRGETWIFSNADSVRMYKNDRLLKEYVPADSPYKNLKHGPIKIDDFVGNAINEGENFSPKLSNEIKEMMNATALYGLSNLPKRVMYLAAKAILIHRLTIGDAVRLYNKYVGDWGGTSTVYRFEAVKDGKVVKTLVKEPPKKVSLLCNASADVLKVGRTYDVALVRIKAVDQNGNVLPFFGEPVSFSTTGDIEIIGPKVMSLKGGMGGVYVRTKKDGEGSCSLAIETSQAEPVNINFKIERDLGWNALK